MDKTCRLRAFNRTPSPLSEMYLERKESEMFSRFSQNLAEVKKESKREAGHLDKSNSQRSVDRSQSLFYFVSQDSHSQAGLTRSQCTAQTQCMIRPTCTTGWEDAQARCKDQRRLFPRKQQPDNPRNRILFGQKRIDEWYQQKPSSAKTEEGNFPRSS